MVYFDRLVMTQYIQFNDHQICKARIEDRELVISEYDTNRLFAIHLYVSYVTKRNDFLRSHKIDGDEIRYHLRASDVLLFLKEGFKYSY